MRNKISILLIFIFMVSLARAPAIHAEETRQMDSSFSVGVYNVTTILINEHKEPILGAWFSAYEIESGNSIDTWQSTYEHHEIKGVLKGKSYVIKEEYTPEGYIKSDDVYFNVTGNGHIEIVNTAPNPVQKIIEQVKTGDTVTITMLVSLCVVFVISIIGIISIAVISFSKRKERKL